MMNEIRSVPASEVVHWRPVQKLNQEEFQMGRLNRTRLNAHYTDGHTYYSFLLSFCLHININMLSSHLTMHTWYTVKTNKQKNTFLFMEVVLHFTI